MDSNAASNIIFQCLGFCIRKKSPSDGWEILKSLDSSEEYQEHKYFSVLSEQDAILLSNGVVENPQPTSRGKTSYKGIFCQSIFGRKNHETDGFPMGHIKFPCPIPHPIFFLESPSLISILLGINNDKALEIALGIKNTETIFDKNETGIHAIKQLAIEADYRSILENANKLVVNGDVTNQDRLVKITCMIQDLTEQDAIPECLFLNVLPVLPSALRKFKKDLQASADSGKVNKANIRFLQAFERMADKSPTETLEQAIERMADKSPTETLDFGEVNKAYMEILQSNQKLGRLLVEGRAFQRQIAAAKYELFKSVARLFNLTIFRECLENYYRNSLDCIDLKILQDLSTNRSGKEENVSEPINVLERYEVLMGEIGETEFIALGKQRVGQNVFRQSLVDYWGCCAITGLKNEKLLRASHAKPWADCETDRERLDVFNGFLLSPQFDALFDAGLMTIEESGKVVFSENVSKSDYEILGLGICTSMKINLDPRHAKYLAWHRKYIFNGMLD